MTTTIRLILCGLALSVPAEAILWAAEEATPRDTGRVLILDNEHTLEGDIQRDGDDYRIRRGMGEVWVPGAKVLRLCASWEDAYAYLRDRANLSDPDERLRLASWCQLHGLRKEALLEVTVALELRPNHAESRRLQGVLRRVLASARAPVAAVPRLPATPLPTPLPCVDLSSEALSQFTTRVQPILMNACASCHASNRGGNFKIIRSYHDGGLNQRATQQNLAAVMAQVNLRRPPLSPLLIKAVSDHAHTGRAPLKGRQSPAFHHLQEWLRKTLEDNPHLLEEPAQAAPAQASRPPETTPQSEAPRPAEPENVASFHAAVPVNPTATAGAPVISMTGGAPAAGSAAKGNPSGKAPAVLPARIVSTPDRPPLPEPADPFDAVIFNRQMHPDRP